jgi:polyhydroxyalkanoate synthesis regulator phasin
MSSNHDNHHDDREREARGYERMLEQLRESFDYWRHETGPRLGETLNNARESLIEFGELTREEADRVAEALRRDLEEAVDYTARTERDVGDWLRMDTQLIESWLWDKFSAVVDQSRVDWLRFQQALNQANTYRSGELTGPGTLICRGCGESLQFARAGHIPPCPSCRGSAFTRPMHDEAAG